MRLALVMSLFCLPVALSAASYELRGSMGSTSFLDDGPQNHLLLAPAVRYYFLPKLAVEAEFQYLRQNGDHHDTVFLPSIVWDVRSGRVVPYLSAGVGVIRSSFVRFSTTESYGQLGGGVKIHLNRNWYISPDVRLGWEPHARFSVAVGYRWP